MIGMIEYGANYLLRSLEVGELLSTKKFVTVTTVASGCCLE
jgi:hypothetical protein